MARQESDREDLWAEAVALASRAELLLPGRTEPVLVGRRSNGWWSIYFGQNVMFQFTADGALRRAFRDGTLFRTQGSTLARLTRERTSTETILRRHDLNADELAEFQTWMQTTLAELDAVLRAGRGVVNRLILTDDVTRSIFLQDAVDLLQTVLSRTDFLAPSIRGKT